MSWKEAIEMTTAVLLALMWTLVFLLFTNLRGALALGTLVTAGIMSLGTRLRPKGILLGMAAILAGMLLSNQGLAFFLAPLLGALVLAAIVSSLAASLWRRPPDAPV